MFDEWAIGLFYKLLYVYFISIVSAHEINTKNLTPLIFSNKGRSE